MLAKTKKIFRKLEFGVIEFLVGALMVIGLIGYFASVPADLDWIDHTVSFILFSYLFYKLNITSILFGKTSRFANLIIIISYFSLFFKDIISYTALDAFKFKVIKFVDYFYLLLSDNIPLANLVTFYTGIIGILAISIYLAKKMEISHPSLLYAIFQSKIKNKAIKFLSIFILLLGFYYFVYNIILEWLEFVIDDPVIAAGTVFFAYKIAKHRQKFHANNVIFKIGDFSAGLYGRFISLFHYKKTLPLAISGLLILHALSDLGVFAYSLIFSRDNFYLEFLNAEHAPFLKLFLEDAKNLPSFAAVPLLIVYLLNASSLAIFFIIPIAVWAGMFSKEWLHPKRAFLFFIYSSAAAYMLMPGYVITSLEEPSIKGVDIISLSLLESRSVLDNFFPNKASVIAAVSLISIFFGLIVYLLGSSAKIRRELYAISIIGGLVFYAIYLYYFFGSLLAYFYDNIMLAIFTPHFMIALVLAVFLALSIIFYIGGYLVFLNEIVTEYHRQKSPEAIDNKLFSLIKRVKRIEKTAIKPRKAQLIGEVFKYGLVGVVSVFLLAMGYAMINTVKERACKTEIAKFEIELRNIDKSLRFGAKELQDYDVPCKAERIYFFDLNKSINPENFKDIPLMMDSLGAGANNNVFVIKDSEVKRSFYAGNLEINYPSHICFIPKFGRISFFIEGAGKSAKVTGACEQPECTFIPVDISEEESRKIIKEAIQFGCSNCPADFDKEIEKIRLTRQNVDLFRKFTFCGNITKVEILIKPKKGREVKDFTFYEFIPKDCIDDLSRYLAENIEGNVEIKSDPLIMWHFSGIAKEQSASYKLGAELNDECRQAIQGLGVAQFVEREEPEISAPNTPPKIVGLNDISVAGIGLKKNVVSNLWKYAQDRETDVQGLVYSIIDQTNANLVDCKINNEKHIDCEVKQNKEGFSTVTLQVDDFEFRSSASFNVQVSQFCKNRERKTCVGNKVFWLDSCNNQEELHEICGSDRICEDGECKRQCIPNVERKCRDGDKLYWFDSCGKKGQLYFNCRDNLARTQCRNGKCCIGNSFCQTPEGRQNEDDD